MDSREMNPDLGIVNSSSGDNSPKRISKEKRTGFSGFKKMNPNRGIVNSSSDDNSPKRIPKEKRNEFSGFKKDESGSWNRELVFRRQLP